MADSQRNSHVERDIDQAITALKKGAYLLKYGRRGKPKFCPFRLSADESALIWYHGKEERQLEIRSVSRIIPGQRTAIFQRYPRPEKEYQSFSLIYSDRSLDLICKDKDEAEVWFVGLKALISRRSIRNLRSEARNENMLLDSPNTKRIYPTAASEQGDTPQVEILPQSRLGKAFSDIISYTAANKVQAQQPEQIVNSLSSLPSIVADSANGRSSTAETFRISLSSAVSSSSQGSYREDFDALGDVLIWGEGVADGALGGGVQRVINNSSSSAKIDALLPKSLESTTVLDVHNIACGGKHAVLVTKQGEIFSWGEEEGGRLGHGVEDDVAHPKLIENLSGLNINFVACGEYHSCAVTSSGDLYTWGDGSYVSGLGRWIPRQVYGFTQSIYVSYVSCGPWHTALVTSSGQLFTFGDGTFGALGHGDHSSTGVPREVESLRGLRTIKVACGVWHTAAVVDDVAATEEEEKGQQLGKLYTWGDGDRCQLGHGDREPRLVPERVAEVDDVSFCQVACGHSLTVALTNSGRVYTMGDKVYGQLGCPLADGVIPTCVKGTIDECFVKEISCGLYHVAVLTSKSEVYTWGKGTNGQLGHGDTNDRHTPTVVNFLKDKQVKKVFCGANFTAVIHLHKLASTADNSVCSGCRNLFNFRRKRHNCYNCGLVFCKVCSSRKSLKASLAPALNKPYRVCDDCFNKLKKVLENGYVAQIPKVKSRNSLSKPYEALEKDIKNHLIMQGQFSRLSSSDSLTMSEGRISKRNMKLEVNDTRLFPVANGNLEKGNISLKGISTKNSSSSSAPGSRIISRTPSPVSRFSNATPPSPYSVRTSDVSPSESKQKNQRLSEEIDNLRAQVQDLSSKYQTLESEVERKEKLLNEATELAANEAEKCRAAKEVIKSLSAKLKEMSEKVSEERVANRRLESVARNDSDDPNSTSSERNEASVVSSKSESTINSSDSSISNKTKAPTDKAEWVIQDEPGVYITLSSLPGGRTELRRVRFSRKRFTEEQAEKWWAENVVRVCERHNIRTP